MFDKRSMGQMRSMLGGGVPKGKLATAMLEILVQLPVGTTDLKNVILHHLGFMASMASSRDINAAWNDTKKKASKNILISSYSMNAVYCIGMMGYMDMFSFIKGMSQVL